MNEIEKLKSCPFCGGEAKIEDWTCAYEIGTSIRCSTCGAAIHEGIEDGDGCHDRAVKAWNRRAQENPQPLTLEELQEMDGEPVWIIENGKTECGVVSLEGNCFEKEPVITLANGNFYLLKEYNGKTWLAYRTKPEGSGEK